MRIRPFQTRIASDAEAMYSEFIMGLLISAEKAPLRTDAEGVVRVAGTRVTLDTVVAAFEDGATPEEIAQQYPALALADIYAVIGYYLRRRDNVTDYLRGRRTRAESVRRRNETRTDPQGIRARLTARRKR